MHVSDRFWTEADDAYVEDAHASGCDEDGKTPLHWAARNGTNSRHLTSKPTHAFTHPNHPMQPCF